MRVLLGLLGTLILVYCGVAVLLYGLQRRIIFRPDVRPPDLETAAVPGLQSISLHAADGLDLLGWWLPPPLPDRPVILYLHGNGGNLADRANRLRQFAAAGLSVLMPEYPGYGGNPGAPSETSLRATAVAALQFLRTHSVQDRSVVVYGESLGTGVASWVAAGRPFRGVVLESPFTSVIALAREQYWFLPVKWLVRDPFDTLGRIGRIEAPLLVAFGERDQIVPPWMGRAVFAAAPEPKQLWVSAEGGHEDLAQFGLVAEVIRFVEGLDR